MPKLVNLVSHLVNRSDAATPLVSVTTALPGTPQLFWSCANPVRLTTPRRRFGEDVPHGLASWVPQIDKQGSPDICQGDTAIWLGGPPCKSGQPCNFFIAQPQSAPPLVDWSTPVIPCTPRETSPVAVLIYNLGEIINSGTTPHQCGSSSSSADPPLGAGGSEITLPGGGTFQITIGMRPANVVGSIAPFAQVLDRSGKVWAQTDPYENDGRGCAGIAKQTKRQQAPATPLFLSTWVADHNPPGVGRWQIETPALLMIEWWSD